MGKDFKNVNLERSIQKEAKRLTKVEDSVSRQLET